MQKTDHPVPALWKTILKRIIHAFPGSGLPAAPSPENHVPLERIAAHAPARLAVVYHSEVPMGASFTLLRAQTGENGWYFVGTDGEKKHFEANLTLTE